MFNLIELELTNFRSWKHLHLDLNKKGIFVIRGDNGSGKSSIRHAIEYIITDSISDGIPLDELSLNKDGNCIINAVFTNDTDVVTITKYRGHSTHNNKIIFTINNQDFTKSDRKDTQKEIERYFGVNSDTLSVSTIFSQYSKSFPEAKESERKTIIYNYIDFSNYNKLLDLTKSDLDKIHTKVFTIEERIKGVDRDISSLISAKEVRRQKYNEFESSRQYRINRIDRDLDILNTDIKKYDEVLLQTHIDTVSKQLEDLPVVDEQRSLELMQSIKELVGVIATKTSEKKEATKQLDAISKSNICPILKESCDRLALVDEDLIQQKREDIDFIQLEIGNLTSKKIGLEEEYSKICNAQSLRSSLENKLLRLNTEKQTSTENLNKLTQQIIKAKTEREFILAESNPYELFFGDIDNRIEKLERHKNRYLLLKTALEKQIPYLTFWITGLGRSGIPNILAEGFLNSLELETNKYLSMVGDRLCVSIQSQTELKSKEIREKISYTVKSADKAISDYKSYSSGQRQRIRVADICAFHTLASKFSFLVLDEVLDLSLDDAGKDNMINLLNVKAQDVDTLLVISHNPKIKDLFNNVMDIKLIDGVSHAN